jgi:hypothetical protein
MSQHEVFESRELIDAAQRRASMALTASHRCIVAASRGGHGDGQKTKERDNGAIITSGKEDLPVV